MIRNENPMSTDDFDKETRKLLPDYKSSSTDDITAAKIPKDIGLLAIRRKVDTVSGRPAPVGRQCA